jgi:peptidoglycan-associated lipoprotein
LRVGRWSMVQREMGFLLQVVKMGVVSGCVVGLLTGCSSQMRTTIISGSEAPKVQVTQLEPETVVVEEVVAQPVPKERRMDIPVEEPARPAPRSELPEEIFATSKTPDVRSETPVRSELEPSVPAQEESVVSALPLASEPAMRQPAVGIPPIDFEPEMPALPRVRQDAGSSASQAEPPAVASTSEVAIPAPQPEASVHVPPAEVLPLVAQADNPLTPEPPSQKEPVQVAKVMPQELKQAEIITKTLEAALSDVYFDYDQFAIRDDAIPLLKANAQLLSATLAEKKIVIEGHCDERGTQSYNMVLGERRAKAAKQFLADLGVPTENLQVMSYGKDKPFCMEQTEDCWQENRRGHFVIK